MNCATCGHHKLDHDQMHWLCDSCPEPKGRKRGAIHRFEEAA